MQKLRCGVIGTGRLGNVHCRMYAQSPRSDFIGVYDVNVDAARRCADKFSVKAFNSLDGLIDEVDVVSVVVPTSFHYEITKQALQSGIHCLVEKPFTGNVEEAKELVVLAKKNKLKLQVGHVERFNSAMAALKRLSPGAPKFVECHRLSPFPNRSTDVSVVMDLMIHDIDVCHWFINAPLESCEAVGVEVLTDHVDIANARLRFKNGSICDITASRITDKSLRKIRMFFQHAYASINYKAQTIDLYTLDGNKIAKKEIMPQKIEPLKEEVESFLDAVINNGQVFVSGEDALAALITGEKVLEQIKAHNKAFFDVQKEK